MLIPKAKKVAVVEAKGECTQEVIKALTTPNLNVKDPTGQQIDLNHVWVGIDVANYPTTNLLVRIFGGLKGPAVATWAGDVGSVLGEFYYKTQGEGDIARYYEIMSGDDDMYSNAEVMASRCKNCHLEAAIGNCPNESSTITRIILISV